MIWMPYEYAKNPDAGVMQGWKPFATKEEAFAALQSYIEDEYRWAVVLKENNKVIGLVKLSPDENRGRYFAKFISYVLSSEYWGKGYIPEAVQRIIRYAFEVIKIDILTAFCYPHNVRSKRVIEKCGFTYETTIEQGQQIYTGQTFDTVCYSIMKTDYMTCYCGHDCTRCITYLATVKNDDELRKQSQQFYKNEFGLDIPLSEIHCMGGRSDDIFKLCRGCPWMKCHVNH